MTVLNITYSCIYVSQICSTDKTFKICPIYKSNKLYALDMLEKSIVQNYFQVSTLPLTSRKNTGWYDISLYEYKKIIMSIYYSMI